MTVLVRPASAIALCCSLALTKALAAQSAPTDPYRQLGRSILQELIETNTTHSTGNTTVAAEKEAARFLAAGFPAADVQVIGPKETNRNLLVRYRGAAGGTHKPILLMAHLDVVEAKREDWSVDPFVLLEKDGYFYGRGTLDIKGAAANLVASLLRLKQEGFTPDRDIILALTAGEESGGDYNGIQWLIQNHKEVLDAEYAINVDAGGGELRGTKVVTLDVQASEKVYQTFSWTVRNPGGHSSLPTPRNAIYQLSAALTKWSRYQFPARLTDVTRAYFTRMAPIVGGSTGADMRAVLKTPLDSAAAARLSARSPFYNALLRTTCVATELQGGHAENALPQLARGLVNCRMLPGEDPKNVQKIMTRVAADTSVVIDTVGTAVPSPPSPLRPDLERVFSGVSESLWGNVVIVPYMETGATDGLFLRNAGLPVYGVSGIPYDPDDVRAHGRDERITVQGFYDGLEFTYRTLKGLTGATTAP